ncbi:hypothetical protein C5167_013735 [Papaver somniferum]|uniref:Uncharacterized protein n=1 Tax=Papaver somniferum TaxID=3469 RepID=A0A4Y7J542_PAPSO|nr:hypothetical protein C5167_013735 [Papaver somniferum]
MENYPQSFLDEKKSRAELRELLIDQEIRLERIHGRKPERRHSHDFSEYDYLLIDSPSQSLYLMVDPWQEMLRMEKLGSNEFVENQHEPAHITNESSSDHAKANTDCEEADGVDVVKDGVGSGLENSAGKVAGQSQEKGLVFAEVLEDGVVSELDKYKEYEAEVNEVCKAVEVLKDESSGSDVDWNTEREKLFSSQNRTKIAVGKKLKNDMLPEIEKIHKRKEKLLKKQQREAILLDDCVGADGLGPGRAFVTSDLYFRFEPSADVITLNNSTDDSVRSIDEAIKIINFRRKQPSPASVKKETAAKLEPSSTNGRLNGPSSTPPSGKTGGSSSNTTYVGKRKGCLGD